MRLYPRQALSVHTRLQKPTVPETKQATWLRLLLDQIILPPSPARLLLLHLLHWVYALLHLLHATSTA